MASRFRAPWTAAIVLLIMIWTVFFINGPSHPQLDTTVSEVTTAHTNVIIDKPDDAPAAAVAPIDAIKAAPPPPPPTAPQPPAPQMHKPNDQGDDETPSSVDIDIDALAAAKADSFERTVSSTKLSKPTPSKAAPKKVAPKPQKPAPTPDINATDRPLVTYVYSQTDSAEANLRYFIKHALNAAADFIFIINGEAKQAKEIIPLFENVKVVERENDCYDLGAHAEILTTEVEVARDGKKQKMERWTGYKRFILLNASVRGPFMPNWSGRCWMEAYLSKITDEVKLVGMTGNCWPQFHVQSMIWATDATGISVLLYPPQPAVIPEGLPDDWKEVGINGCFHTWDEAVHAEVFSTQIIRDAGYKVAVMMSAFYSDADYIDHCDSGGNGDVLWNGRYFGTNVHPYETIFMKTNRDIDPVLIEKLTAWKKGERYSSYDYC